MTILLGTNIYPARGGAATRQANGIKSLQALERVSLVNLYLEGEEELPAGFVAARALKLDSQKVSGRMGRRKPIVSEIFNSLATEAAGRGHRYFCFTNTDVIVPQKVIDYALDEGREAYIFSREDFDGATGQSLGVMPWGTDLFIIDARWWMKNRKRFRAYIAGEPVWDNVYTSKLLCHADAILLNREPLIRHEQHESEWRESPFAQYVRLLAALDAPYFSLWVKYCDRLMELRSLHASPEEELALQKEIFVYRPEPVGQARQVLRVVKARIRYVILNSLGRRRGLRLQE